MHRRRPAAPLQRPGLRLLRLAPRPRRRRRADLSARATMCYPGAGSVTRPAAGRQCASSRLWRRSGNPTFGPAFSGAPRRRSPMPLDPDAPSQGRLRERSPNLWLSRLRGRAEIAARDGARLARDRTAMTASVGRAQMERAQSFIAFHARRRPLTVTGLALSAGLLIGVALASGAARRRR